MFTYTTEGGETRTLHDIIPALEREGRLTKGSFWSSIGRCYLGVVFDMSQPILLDELEESDWSIRELYYKYMTIDPALDNNSCGYHTTEEVCQYMIARTREWLSLIEAEEPELLS